MDETPEELERIRREAEQIDPYRYRRRTQAILAIACGGLLAGIVWLVIAAFQSARNPCERVRDHYCREDARAPECAAYEATLQASEKEANPLMRSNVRGQCERKIERLAAEGVKVR
jgi:type VI protein secretion system component VasK